MNNSIRTEITDDMLKKEELQLFDFLREVIKSSGCNTVVRVAGGWVRDKLMGRESEDIDLVVDNMSGGDFGNIIKNEQHRESNDQTAKKVKVIKSNPNQHKFVATATVTLFGFKLEITSLRPHNGELGTASSDAMERDFTINSLFYNINEKKLEDITGMGIHDITQGIIRTPMDPNHTLGRDPLRCLRCVRFATRFAKQHFVIDESLRTAILSPTIHEELSKNITRPRIYTELTKMLNGPYPIYGMKLIFELNLHSIIFSPPPEDSNVNSSDTPFWTQEISLRSHLALFVFERLVVNDTGDVFCGRILTSMRVLLLACTLLNLCIPQPGKSGKLPITKYNMINYWMWTKQDTNLVWDLTKITKRFQTDIIRYNKDGSFDQLKAGLQLRKIGKLWEHVKHLVVISMATESYNIDQLSQMISNTTLVNNMKNQISHLQQKFVNSYEEKLLASHLLGEKSIWEVPPVVSGAEIFTQFGVTGKILGEWVKKQMEWQILNPTKSKDECIAWLKSLPEPQ